MTGLLARWGHGAVLSGVLVAALTTLAPAAPGGTCVTVGHGTADAVWQQAQRLLRAAEEARWADAISYKELQMLFLRRGTETVTRSIAWRPPAELRVEEDHDGGRRIAVWNRDEQWLYDSRVPFVLHTEAGAAGLAVMEPPVSMRPLVTAQAAFGHWGFTKSHGPGGRPVYVVEGGRHHAYSRYWIDEDNFFPWKEEHYGPGCELVGIIVRSDVDFDPELSDDVFRFEPPPGTEVIDDPVAWRVRSIIYGLAPQTAIDPAVPNYVPPGYTLVSGGITEVDGSPALHLRFHDGKQLLSLFQVLHEGARSLAGVTRRLSDGSGAEVLVMGAVKQGYLFLVVGDVSQAEAERILANLDFSPDD
ncbi:MAG: hypothetical protein BAA04_10750 [Firmicutes bacterium ZCTH02-B6]|nr:MAG: hypothetical protein BAA04_10750 [Firmicutes bacterium ZCTH02-B6]